jgi:hypothetical protein
VALNPPANFKPQFEMILWWLDTTRILIWQKRARSRWTATAWFMFRIEWAQKYSGRTAL